MRFVALAAALVLCGCQADVPDLGTTEQPILNGIAFTPPSGGSVGDVQVGQQSMPWGIDVYPVGPLDQSYTITSIDGCSDFLVNAPNLPAEIHRTCLTYQDPNCIGCEPVFAPPQCIEWEIVDYYFDATFAPNVQGPSSCAITLWLSNGTSKFYTLNGNGTVPPIDIDVSPSSIQFGDVRRNTSSSPASVYVRNLGGSTLSVSGTSLSSGFSITSGPTGAFSVPPTGSVEIQLTCDPTATGDLSGTFRVDSDDPQTPSETVSLSCNGIDSNLDVSPSPAALATTRVGEPVQRNVVFENTGAAPMIVQSATLTGAGLSATGLPAASSVIQAGGSVTATVTFAASTAGDAMGMLTVMYDGGQVRSVPVTATALATSMSITPAGMIDLGPVCIGQTSEKPVNIAANAEGAFLVTSISGIQAPFTLTPPSLPATIQGSGANRLTLDLGAAPTTVGPAMQTVTITTDIPNDAPRTLDLSVTGLTAGVSATPGELDLGPTDVNKTTIGQEIELTNCGTGDALLSNPRIEGNSPDDFAIVQQGNLTLSANGSSKFLIVATPHAVGHRTALFSIDHPGGTASVMLTTDGLGEGGGVDPEEGGGPASYYQCSTGSASTGLPLGLALAGLLVRRRRRR